MTASESSRKFDAAKRPSGLRAMADGMIYLAGQTGIETANVWKTADILRSAADEIERLLKERDEAREAAAMWEKVALREASINGARICGKETVK